MKRDLLMTVLTLLLSIPLMVQMNISTNFSQNGIFNEEKDKWEILSTGNDEITFLEFNKDVTMCKHTTTSITSAYIIKSYEEDKEAEQWELNIVSDVGNKYLMTIDIKNKMFVSCMLKVKKY